MAANLGSEQTQSFPGYKHFQNGNSGGHSVVPSKGEWVTLLDFSDASFHIPIAQRSRNFLRFHLNKVSYQFTSLPFGLATAPLEFTKVVKEVKLMAQARGIRIHQYLNDWLLRAPSHETCLRHTRILLALCQELGWVVNMQKLELLPQQVFNFFGYRFDLLTGRVLHTQDRWSTLRQKVLFIKNQDRETSLVRSPSHEAHSMAPEMPLACPGSPGEGNSCSCVSPSSLRLVAERKQGASGSTFTSSSARSASLYRCFKRRLGRSLRRLHCKRRLLRNRKKTPHKFFGAQSSIPGPQKLQASLQRPDCPDSHRQHNGGVLHQHGGRYEIRLSLCPPMETSILVPSQGNSPESKAHCGSLERDSGQAFERHNQVIQTEWSLDQQVFSLLCSNWGLPQVDLFATRFNHKLPKFVSPVLDQEAWAVDTLSVMGESGRVCLSSGMPSQPSGFQGGGSGLSQNDSSCSRVAQHALVLGPSQPFSSDPLSTASARGSGDSAVQRSSSQEPQQHESACLAPRACAIQKQGFTEEVATRTEVPQRLSTRAMYKSKWAIFVRWCDSHKVDFRSPSISQIAEFLLYLFKERNLQPSTIEGYRTAIVDMVGNEWLSISKDENLTHLLDSFHRDKPKGRREIPSWNLSLVLHQLTKAPFEPLRKASLKHLTFKTVFLLALGSGKRRSEIHGWLYKNIRHQENWTQVSLYPSPSFISKNQLAREGPASVAPVIIPALAPSLDRPLREDKSLCPVRALRYYLDRTKDMRASKELVFISFSQSFQKDIVPATISWIKQTVILCYQLSDEEAQNLHQVKAHDARAFAASRAFHGGFSLDQILSACHWRAHNTFTQFYLKDLAWADSELYHLGPIVAAQQVHND